MLLLLLLLPCEISTVRPRHLLPTATFTRAHIVLSLKAVKVCSIYFYTGLCPHRPNLMSSGSCSQPAIGRSKTLEDEMTR